MQFVQVDYDCSEHHMQFRERIRPSSASNCLLEIHMRSKAFSSEIVEPPIQLENWRLAGAIKVTFVLCFGSKFWMLLCKRPQNDFIIVVLPATTMELWRPALKSMSQALIQLLTNSWIPGYSRPIRDGLKRISGARALSALLMLILDPSGSK